MFVVVSHCGFVASDENGTGPVATGWFSGWLSPICVDMFASVGLAVLGNMAW